MREEEHQVPKAPSPWQEAMALAKGLPDYVRLAWKLGKDERMPQSLRLLLVGGSIYAVSPVDLVPGVIPVLGQLDNVIVLLATILKVVDEGPADVASEHLETTGITRDEVAADLVRAQELARVTARGYGRAIWGAAKLGGRASLAAGRLAWRATKATGRGVGAGVRWLKKRRQEQSERHEDLELDDRDEDA